MNESWSIVSIFEATQRYFQIAVVTSDEHNPSITFLSSPMSVECLQYEEQLRDLKSELVSILDNIATMDLPDSDDISILHETLEKETFSCGLKLKQLIAAIVAPSGGPTPAAATTHSPSTAEKGMRLPKLEVPTFDGQTINWNSFWEQFEIAIHDSDFRSLS